MDVQASSLFQELQSLRFEATGRTPEPVNGTVQQDFGQLLQSALENVNSLQQDTNSLRTRFDMGDRSISLSDVMIAGQKSSIAFEATVQVRNKVVEAYKTIMNMPV
ncbi:flagellar hook-basal body complex protein FliE [Pseudaeromonas sharmana]|uniref:Flagellar hook-basal body complex protein FliE n=1 Tax=Pseudaeromonas sharmana TaxID=328412 RepID=A0ABV8CJF1_9GAMM